ncbi:MAG: PEP-CTERM sorting domain-containing protein [Terriglobia bacterium]
MSFWPRRSLGGATGFDYSINSGSSWSPQTGATESAFKLDGTAAATPEPASMLLLGTALGAALLGSASIRRMLRGN